jgi:biotin carboxylase
MTLADQDVASAARLIVIGASPTIAELAREIDARTIFVQQPGSAADQLIGTQTNLYTVDFTDDRRFRSLVQEVIQPLGPAAAVSVTETGLRPAAVANEILGTPGTPVGVVERFNDKYLMRQLLAECLPELSGRYAAPQSGSDADGMVRQWGASAKAVLKPRMGTASLGVRLIDGPGGLDAEEDLSSFILEEYFPGQEYSAETFSRGGVHRLVALTEKRVFESTFVEAAHVVPASGLDTREFGVVEYSVSAFLDAMGLTDGPAHTEFKLVSGAVKIIESHTRVGGDGITDLVRRTTGVNLKRLALGWPVGVTEAECTELPEAAAAAVHFISAPAGRVEKVEKAPHPGSVEAEGVNVVSVDVSVKPGDIVEELSDSMKRVGRVMVTGSAPGPVLAAARALAARVVIETRP